MNLVCSRLPGQSTDRPGYCHICRDGIWISHQTLSNIARLSFDAVGAIVIYCPECAVATTERAIQATTN